MSYYFNMAFKRISGDLLTEMDDVKQHILSGGRLAREIKNSKPYWPSVRYGQGRGYNSNLMDEYWLYNFAKIRFVYWEKYQLLGILGWEDLPDGWSKSIEFQNSCDQDYELSEWPSIQPFCDIVDSALNLSADNLLLQFDSFDGEDITSESVEYMRRSSVYSSVYSELKLDKWLHGNRDEEYKCYTLSLIDSQEENDNIRRTVMSVGS